MYAMIEARLGQDNPKPSQMPFYLPKEFFASDLYLNEYEDLTTLVPILYVLLLASSIIERDSDHLC